RELVAADAPDEVVPAHVLTQHPADLAQELVAHLVAVGVVDELEAAEADEEEGRPLAAADGGLLDGGVEALLERPARVGTGQGVDLGTPGGLALEGDGLPEALHERDAGAGAHEGEELERLLAVERVGEEPGLQVEAGGEEAHQGEADEPSQAAR